MTPFIHQLRVCLVAELSTEAVESLLVRKSFWILLRMMPLGHARAEIMNSCTVIVVRKPWRECYESIGIRTCDKPGSTSRFAASVRAGIALYSS